MAETSVASSKNLDFSFIDKVAETTKISAVKEKAEKVKQIIVRLESEASKPDYHTNVWAGAYLEEMATVIDFGNRHLRPEQFTYANPFHFRTGSPQLITRPFSHFCDEPEFEMHTLDVSEHDELPKDSETGLPICPFTQTAIGSAVTPTYDYNDQRSIYKFVLNRMGVVPDPESELENIEVQSPRGSFCETPSFPIHIPVAKGSPAFDSSMFFSRSL